MVWIKVSKYRNLYFIIESTKMSKTPLCKVENYLSTKRGLRIYFGNHKNVMW